MGDTLLVQKKMTIYFSGELILVENPCGVAMSPRKGTIKDTQCNTVGHIVCKGLLQNTTRTVFSYNARQLGLLRINGDDVFLQFAIVTLSQIRAIGTLSQISATP